jgi:hypothetical protein
MEQSVGLVLDMIKSLSYSKTVKNWYKNFVFCFGKPNDKDEAESFYNAGFDDGAGQICGLFKDAGVPLETIMEVYSKLDPKGESISYGMIMEDWSDEAVA